MIEIPVPLLFATRDGQARRIVARLADRLAAQGFAPALYDLAQSAPELSMLAAAPMVVMVAPVRFGKHLPPVELFVRKHRAFLRTHPLALASINLTARKPGKDTPETNPYFKKWIRRHRLAPTLAAVFAGRLEYRLYRWWEKQAIRLIMLITGGPTNFDALVDYTAWDGVDAFAARIADHCRKAGGAR